MSRSLNLKTSRQQLLELPESVNDEPIIVTDGEQPIMVALSYEHYSSLLETIEILTDEDFSTQLKESIQQDKAGETINWEVVKKQLGI
ncbi:type II toxin-antitoxin system Phd/YefM family antitoxin [Chroococcus sp. FPU101]|uniref:type II toxin-antitoxin system Phd/YefM family antitoxin n=1 Tax=Chroococcus sp. FPU101 TaxID=1974212 RepID=UPI001A8CCBAC|nr:type II toxin-antitoxin system Phd/YefM family antitoxin [Chroococcus sp. FPU101]GFE71273.1 hypothetical protein CFPU101_38830 [Chroococcus sp. FPU101]